MKKLLMSAALATFAIACNDGNVRTVEPAKKTTNPPAQPAKDPVAVNPTPDVTLPTPEQPAPELPTPELPVPEVPTPETPTPVVVVPEEPAAPAPREAVLRLRGAKAEGLQAALLRTADLKILADGTQIPFKLEQAEVDLAQATQSWRVASFVLPENAERIQVVLDVADDKGTFAGTSDVGRIEAPGIPITLEAKADQIALRGKLVVEVDLERSLVKTETGVRELVPVYRVDY